MTKNASIAARLCLLLGILLLALLPTVQASARFVKCRTDPIFQLSNGDSINVTLEIGTDSINVRNVTYELHVPAGVTVKKVTYTAGGMGTKEMYKVYQDSPALTYTTDTVVTTQNTGAIAVLATTKLNATFAQSDSGYNGEHLIVTVVKP